jgi:hypothetical protein
MAAVVAVLLAGTAAGFAWWANKGWTQAEVAAGEAKKSADKALLALKEAESRRLAVLSESARPSRLDQAMLLAVEASVGDTLEARNCLLGCLLDRPEISRFLDIPEGSVASVAFGPGGALAAGFNRFGGGGGVVLLDAKGDRLRDPVELTEGPVTSVAFGPGGVLAAGFNRDVGVVGGGVVLIDGDPASWRAKAAQVAHRNFTRAEWRQFFPGTPYRRTIRSCPWPLDLSEDERRRAEAGEREHPTTGKAP